MQPKRRWYQFSLRTLVVVMLLVSLVLGYWGYARRRAQRQWEAVRVIEAAGGYVSLYKELLEDPFSDDSLTSDLPNWRKRLGIECPAVTAIEVSLFNQSGKDIMPYLRDLPQLKEIILHGDWLDDEGMKGLSGCTNLIHLDIESDQITDAGVLGIAGNKNLQKLRVSSEQLTDRGIAVVAQLPKLRSLVWPSANTTGNGLVHLRSHPQLTYLGICVTVDSDIGFEHLSTCTKLKTLVVYGPNTLTSRGISALSRLGLWGLRFFDSPLSKDAVAALPKLTTLNEVTLTGPLSAEDLAHLPQLVSLQFLNIEECKLTGEGLKSLAPLIHRGATLKVSMAGLRDEDMELLATFTNLGHVDLSHSAVTDAGLMKLTGFKSITIIGTQITQEGVKRFEQIAPDVWVRGQYGQPSK